MTRMLRYVLVLAMLGGLAVAPAARAEPCPVLILGAMPVEIDPFIAAAQVTSRVDLEWEWNGSLVRKSYLVGTIEGRDVVMAMTGIGLQNARATTRKALERFECISGIVVSGVSGGRPGQRIGDVSVPAMWDLADGATYPVDALMYEAAEIAARSVSLPADGSTGDVACTGADDVSTHLRFETPSVWTGGVGRSSDPFGGNALPCLPGSDTFGCEPCKRRSLHSIEGTPATATGAIPFLTPEFFVWYQQWSQSDASGASVVDMETAAVAAEAFSSGTPFIAFRSPSDGAVGGPLPKVPGPLGFLPEFLTYRRYAADNAATVALAFLREWPG